jgi:hypothetical protein
MAELVKQYLSNRCKSESRKRRLEVREEVEKRRHIDETDKAEGEVGGSEDEDEPLPSS